MAIKKIDTKRVQNVNFIMEDIHNSSNSIYEHLIDEDYSSLKTELHSLIKRLKNLTDSLQDEL